MRLTCSSIEFHVTETFLKRQITSGQQIKENRDTTQYYVLKMVERNKIHYTFYEKTVLWYILSRVTVLKVNDTSKQVSKQKLH